MRLYIDDDTVETKLVRLLRAAGHDVLIPLDIGRQGDSDPVHMTEAITQKRVVLTQNYEDFEDLSELVRVAGGHHPGVIAIRKDDDPRRNMQPRTIVAAIAKLIRSGDPIADGFVILNQYR